MSKVLFGVDHFLEDTAPYQNKRLALVTNNAAVTSSGYSSRTALLDKGFNIIKLFSPEHGLNAQGEDGAFMGNSVDRLTRLPVISLYGDHLIPSAADLEDVDIVVFDIPDAGCRFYTYLWTMTYVMEACAAAGKPFILLDKPNPIGGNLDMAEGPMLDEVNTCSFLGRWSIPVRHCCTYGELASFFAAKKIKNLHFTVIPVTGWDRNAADPASGWHFTPTSPAIKDALTALIYPGTGLLEGINVDEGRGTDRSFKICGAPWMKADELCEAFNELNLPGLAGSPVNYLPNEGIYAGRVCYGMQFSVTDPAAFRPVNSGLWLLKLLLDLYPDQVAGRLYKTRANRSGQRHLDILLGVKDAFTHIKNGSIFNMQPADNWRSLISPYLLY
jgi:uncharacterized protein YbbC (DUF1343 family)